MHFQRVTDAYSINIYLGKHRKAARWPTTMLNYCIVMRFKKLYRSAFADKSRFRLFFVSRKLR